MSQFENTHHLLKNEVLSLLESSDQGLSSHEAEQRLKKYGLNKLPEGKRLRAITLFLSQFANAMVLLMGLAALLSLLFEHVFDAVLIFAMVLINAIMGFIQEFRAEKSVAALKHLLVSKVLVKRDGHTLETTHEYVTVGDVVQLQEGDKVPADAYVINAHNCYVSESALTGESLPVEKKEGTVVENAPLAERFNMLWMGTILTQGTAEAVVVAVGTQTEFGKIATSLRTVDTEKEHFSEKIAVLSKQMGTIAILSAIVTFLVGYFIRQFSFADISLYTIATLVSALPEGLPIILVIVLAVGAQRMARKNAIVRKLSATETLGVVSVIITDKTGTLTQNIMSARKIYLPGQPDIDIEDHEVAQELAFYQQEEPLLLHENSHLRKLITIAGTCHQIKVSNESNIAFSTIYGDPTEKALFLLAHKAGFRHLQTDHIPEMLDNLPFQQHLRMRGCLVKAQDEKEIFVLGAPESVLNRCSQFLNTIDTQKLTDERKDEIEKKINELSSQGLRVVALASFDSPSSETLKADHLNTREGTFIGLVGLYDPPRPEVKSALSDAREAGIHIVMATGDHPQTAYTIAKEIGLVPSDYDRALVLTQTDIEAKSDEELSVLLKKSQVLARLTPEAKMRVATLFQKQGEVVAMTGDGVNDAPALKKADVGIAMGITGTEVAREASKIVLADDNFASIVAAVKEGRTQFSNLRRTSFFLIMTNISESIALLVALALGYPLPLLPIQILWLNVITGGLTDFALSLEPAHDESMKNPPRSSSENILNLKVLPLIGIITLVTTLLCLGVFHHYLPSGTDKARTALFVILSCSQLLNMFNLRSLKKSVLELGLFTNQAVVLVFVLSFGLLISALWLEPVRNSLQFGQLTAREFITLVVMSGGIFLTAEVIKFMTRKMDNLHVTR